MNTVKLRFDYDGTAYFADSYTNSALQLNRYVNDFTQVESAQGSGTTQRFRVPLINDMLNLFGDLSDPTQSPNIDIRKSIDGSIIVDGFPAFVGSFNVVNIYNNPKEIEIVFKGKEGTLKSKTKNILLKDLLDGELVPYTALEIDSFMTDPDVYINTNGYAFPLVDYGQEFTADTTSTTGTIIGFGGRDFTQGDFKPAISIQKIFDLLATEESIEISNDSNIDDLMTQVIPLHNNESSLPVFDTSQKDYTGYMDRSSNIASTVAGAVATTKIVWNRESSYNVNTNVLASDWIKPPLDGVYNFNINFDYDFYKTNAGSVGMIFDVYVNGVYSAELINDQFYVNAASTSSRNVTKTFSLPLSANDTIQINYRYFQTGAGNNTFTLKTNSRFSMVESPAYTTLSSVDVGKSIDQDFTAWDVIKTIINQCNGIIEENDDTTFNIVDWNTWIDDGVDVDLSDSIEANRQTKYEPTGVTGAKTIIFEYAADEDFYNQAFITQQGQTYGTLKIADTGSEFATNTVKVSVPFASTPLAGVTASNLIIPKFVDENFEVIKTIPRLLYWNAQPIGFDFNITDSLTAVTYTHSLMPYFGNWQLPEGGFITNDSNFGTSLSFYTATGYPRDTLYKRFWERYITETYGINSLKVETNIKLSSYDASNYLMNENVFIDNSRFRLTELKGINLIKDETIKATLIQRKELENIDIAPFYPNDIIDGIVQWSDSSDNSSLGANPTPASDCEASALAYGYEYDSNKNQANQRGQLLIV